MICVRNRDGGVGEGFIICFVNVGNVQDWKQIFMYIEKWHALTIVGGRWEGKKKKQGNGEINDKKEMRERRDRGVGGKREKKVEDKDRRAQR